VEIDRFIREHPDLKQRELGEYITEHYALSKPVSQPGISEHLHHMLPGHVEDLVTLLQTEAVGLFEALVKQARSADDPVDRMLYMVLMEQVLYLGRHGPDLKAGMAAANALKSKKEGGLDALRELLRGTTSTEVYVVEQGAATPSIDGAGPVDPAGGPRIQLPAIPGRPEADEPDVVGPGPVLGEVDEGHQPAQPGELVGED
jgi:hypothetical protein